MALNRISDLKEITKNIKKLEHIGGVDLTQPFCGTNSSSRKIMYSSQLEQVLPLMHSETADISTGYTNEFGRYSSSILQSDDDYEVILKIPKYDHIKYLRYILVVKSTKTNKYKLIEKIDYDQTTESYGYLINNDYIDKLEIGSIIPKGTIIRKSTSFDEYMNRKDGVNMRIAYLSPHKTTEDGIIVSDVAAKKLASPLITTISIVINDNDIPLNLHGDNNIYKIIPDIGEEIKNGLLCAVRRTKNEERLFTQSYDRLREIMISDDKSIINGKVIDIEVFCNNPDALNKSYYNSQLKYYYDKSITFHENVYKKLKDICEDPLNEIDYKLKKFYFNSKRITQGYKWTKNKVFSNIILEVTVIEEDVMKAGDKLTNRFGGKGVASEIRPQHLMPRLDNGEYIDLIFNVFSTHNRENPGQLIVNSLTFISSRFIEYLRSEMYNDDKSPGHNPSYHDLLEEYLNFIYHISPKQSNYIREYTQNIHPDEIKLFLDIILNNDIIKLVIEPISENVSLQDIEKLYDEYPFIWNSPYELTVPITDSKGEIRYVKALNKLYAGRQYIYRLKQYAKDKFSSTSLSATNIKDAPTKSKASKDHKYPYTKTPIRFGEMETGDMEHLDILNVVKNLMIHSKSPKARKHTKDLYTGDPFNVNIDIDPNDSNRSVEIVNVYLKTIGLKIIFKSIAKKYFTPFEISPFDILNTESHLYQPFEIEDGANDSEDYINIIAIKDDINDTQSPFMIMPFTTI